MASLLTVPKTPKMLRESQACTTEFENILQLFNYCKNAKLQYNQVLFFNRLLENP